MKKLAVLALAAALIAGVRLHANPPAADQATEKDIKAVMEQWRHAMMTKDRAAFEKVYHPELRYGHSSGLLENKAEAIAHVVDTKATYSPVDIADMKINVVGNLALVNAKVHYHEVSADGKPSEVNMSVLHVLVKGPQGWQMIGRQSTREGSQ